VGPHGTPTRTLAFSSHLSALVVTHRRNWGRLPGGGSLPPAVEFVRYERRGNDYVPINATEFPGSAARVRANGEWLVAVRQGRVLLQRRLTGNWYSFTHGAGDDIFASQSSDGTELVVFSPHEYEILRWRLPNWGTHVRQQSVGADRRSTKRAQPHCRSFVGDIGDVGRARVEAVQLPGRIHGALRLVPFRRCQIRCGGVSRGDREVQMRGVATTDEGSTRRRRAHGRRLERLLIADATRRPSSRKPHTPGLRPSRRRSHSVLERAFAPRAMLTA